MASDVALLRSVIRSDRKVGVTGTGLTLMLAAATPCRPRHSKHAAHGSWWLHHRADHQECCTCSKRKLLLSSGAVTS